MSRAAENLSFAIAGSGLSATDIVDRAKYSDDAEYLIAVGSVATALNDPRVRGEILKSEREKLERERQEARRAEQEAIEQRAASIVLSDAMRDELASDAMRQATEEAKAGRLGKKSVASRSRELTEEAEKKEKIRMASTEALNAAFRSAWKSPGLDQEVHDRFFSSGNA